MFLVFDIGGSKIRLALAEDGEKLGEIKIIETPQNFKEGVGLLTKATLEIAQGIKINKISGGIAGVLDNEHTKLINSGNLSDWVQKSLKLELENTLQAPVYLENDAALGGLGEAHRGAGRNKKIVAYVTIGTGVGGVRIVDGKIDEKSMGFEPGHQIINFDNEGPRYLENYISGSALKKKYGKKPEDINNLEIWDEAARYLAYGLNNTILHWSPDIVVLGGSMVKSTGIPLEKIRTYLRSSLNIFPYIPQVEKSTLGDTSTLEGALVYLKFH